jgi:DHA1 family tetracycline resistance protein-like MFS transporter
MGVLGAAFALSLVLGPLVGGLVAEHASHAAVGWLGAGLQLLSILTSLFLLRETRPAQPAGPQPRVSTRALLGLPRVSGLMASTFLATFGVAHFTTTFPALAEEQYGLTEAHAGYAFTLFGLVGVLVQGGPLRWLVPRMGERRTALAGLGLLALSLLAVAWNPPLALLWACAAAVGAGTALVTPTVTALVSACVDYRRQGSLLGLHQSATALGRSIGAGIAGWVLGLAGPAAPYGLAAAACAAAGVLLLMQGSGGPRD